MVQFRVVGRKVRSTAVRTLVTAVGNIGGTENGGRQGHNLTHKGMW
mgnify:CR=1 FL=1